MVGRLRRINPSHLLPGVAGGFTATEGHTDVEWDDDEDTPEFIPYDGQEACCVQDADLLSSGLFKGRKSITDYFPGFGHPYISREKSRAGIFVNPGVRLSPFTIAGIQLQILGDVTGPPSACNINQRMEQLDAKNTNDERKKGTVVSDDFGAMLRDAPQWTGTYMQIVDGQPTWADAPSNAVANRSGGKLQIIKNMKDHRLFTTCILSSATSCDLSKVCMTWKLSIATGKMSIPSGTPTVGGQQFRIQYEPKEKIAYDQEGGEAWRRAMTGGEMFQGGPRAKWPR